MKRFLTTGRVFAIITLVVLSATRANAVVPADHAIRQVIASLDPQHAAEHVIDGYLVPSLFTNGREIAMVSQITTDGNNVPSQRKFTREEVNRPGYNEVVVRYHNSDRNYKVTVTNGLQAQWLIRGDREPRSIAAQGNLPNLAYSPDDLRAFRRNDYKTCALVGTANNQLQVACLGGQYAKLFLNLDLVSERLVVTSQTMYDSENRVVKVERREGFTTVAGKPRPQKIIMVDHGTNLDPTATYDDVTTTSQLEWLEAAPDDAALGL